MKTHQMFDYFRNYSSNVYCEDCPSKALYDHCHSHDFDLHSRSQVRRKLHYVLTCNTWDNILAITFKLVMTVHLWMPYNAHGRFVDLDIDARIQSVGKGTKSALNGICNKASNKHYTGYNGRPFFYVTLTLQTSI